MISRILSYIPQAQRAESPQDRHFWAFQLFFMLGFLFHAAEEWDYPHETVITILLIFLFLQFDRFREWIFLTFIALLSYRNLEKFPLLANHSNVLLFVCLFLMPNQVRRCLGSNDRTAQTIASARWLVLLVYFFAGFHKLNTDFFNAEVSCAFNKMQDYISVFQLEVEKLPASIQRFVPLSVVVMEILPAILFLWWRTQKIGVLMILLIHALLAPVGFADFSCVGQSLLFLFVAPDAMSRIPGRKYMSAMAGIFIFMHLFLARDRIEEGDTVHRYKEGAILMAAWAPIWFGWFRSGVGGTNMVFPKVWWHWATVGFLVFFAMNNYLGLRTAGTLSMFSNLTTEGERSNHFLLGSNPIKIFGFQEDVIEVLESDRRIRNRFRRALREGNKVPKIEFARIVERVQSRNFRSIDLTVRYEGQVYTTSDLANSEEFATVFDVPWWQKKYFQFRRIQPEPPQRCCW